MVHAHSEVRIDRPAAEVFRWIADPDLASRWQPEVTAYEITRRTDGMVGTEFVETLTGRGGTAELRGRIVAYRSDGLIEFDLDGPGVRVHARYTVEPTSTGAVVAADVTIDPARRVPALLSPFVRSRMRRQIGRELDRLRRLCEAAQDNDTKEARHGESSGALGNRRA